MFRVDETLGFGFLACFFEGPVPGPILGHFGGPFGALFGHFGDPLAFLWIPLVLPGDPLGPPGEPLETLLGALGPLRCQFGFKP